MDENLKRIKVLAERIVQDDAWVAELREEFRKAIIAAWEGGCTMQQIGDVAGLSRQRISQIIGDHEA